MLRGLVYIAPAIATLLAAVALLYMFAGFADDAPWRALVLAIGAVVLAGLSFAIDPDPE